MTDTDAVSNEEPPPANAPPALSSVDEVRRNPRLARVFRTVAWVFGVGAFFFPVVTAKILKSSEMPDWVAASTLGLIAIAVLAGSRASHYNKAPREVQFQQELNQAKKNLETASGLIARLNEAINDRIRQYYDVKKEVDNLDLAKRLTAEELSAAAHIAADRYLEIRQREDRSRWLRDAVLLLVGFALGIVGNWLAAPLLAWIT